ncbi:hypothetical protein ABH933_001220 [Nocardia sp. GP40]
MTTPRPDAEDTTPGVEKNPLREPGTFPAPGPRNGPNAPGPWHIQNPTQPARPAAGIGLTPDSQSCRDRQPCPTHAAPAGSPRAAHHLEGGGADTATDGAGNRSPPIASSARAVRRATETVSGRPFDRPRTVAYRARGRLSRRRKSTSTRTTDPQRDQRRPLGRPKEHPDTDSHPCCSAHPAENPRGLAAAGGAPPHTPLLAGEAGAPKGVWHEKSSRAVHLVRESSHSPRVSV